MQRTATVDSNVPAMTNDPSSVRVDKRSFFATSSRRRRSTTILSRAARSEKLDLAPFEPHGASFEDDMVTVVVRGPPDYWNKVVPNAPHDAQFARFSTKSGTTW